MWPRCRRAFLFSLTLASLLGTVYGGFRGAASPGGSGWLADDAPELSKVVELPANRRPTDYTINCTKRTYIQPGEALPQPICTFPSPLGELSTTGKIQTGAETFMNLYGPTTQSVFIPTPDPTMALLSMPSTTVGDYVYVYRNLNRASPRLVTGFLQPSYYSVSAAPSAILKSPKTGDAIPVDTSRMFFSANGEWMVVNVPFQGLMRVHMTDLSTKLFAAPIEPDWFIGLASPPLAVSDDGRFVAANTGIWGSGTLDVYDLSTCEDQLDVPTAHREYCAGKNILQGTTLNGLPMGHGLLSKEPDLESPTHLRFVNDDTLSFSAKYAVVSDDSYKAATFVATIPGTTLHKIGLLGMGDSYISGQGEFVYRGGTDDGNNKCHLSELSYPFIVGKDNFDSYNSIACSGATTGNILIGDVNGFEGQVTDKIHEEDRNKSSILSKFLPGYIYQQEFASTYLPEVILLSVGGDDIGFANIVKQCVANTGGGTCYDTYEDRAELVNEIDATYSKLVNTYTTLREQSGGARLYVVGYPQVAQPGGDCGLNVHLNSDEVEFSSQLITYLDSVVERAAKTAGVFYVDTQHAFDGHRLCESGDKAMNGLTTGNDAGITLRGKSINFLGAESYHPTQLGYRLLADTIAGQTQNLAAPMPAPTAYAVPLFDPSAAILQNVPSTGRRLKLVTNDDGISDPVILRGDAQQVTVDGTEVQLQPGSKYQVVLHSDPILLDEGGVGADGDITTTVHIPADVEPGYHVLHVYGKDMAGEDVDVQKTIYVAASADDYDGDGVPNTSNPCLLVLLSGQDVDGDGTDDACDPEVAAAPQVAISGQASSAVEQAHVTGNGGQTPPSRTGVSGTHAVAVLGDSTSTPPHAARQDAATGKFAVQSQRLFRVNWVGMLTVGVGLITSVTLARFWVQKR